MPRPRSPGKPIYVHAPPNADEFARLDPSGVGQFVWLIQVQYQIRSQQAARRIGDLYRAPRRLERGHRSNGGTIGPRYKSSFKPALAAAFEDHTAIIDQRGFMDTEV